MSRRSEHARGVLACGVLLAALELLSIAAATRWPTVDDPAAQWRRAGAEAATADSPLLTADDGDAGQTQASLLLGRQVLARIDDAFDAARLDVAWPARARAPYGRFCPVTRRCD